MAIATLQVSFMHLLTRATVGLCGCITVCNGGSVLETSGDVRGGGRRGAAATGRAAGGAARLAGGDVRCGESGGTLGGEASARRSHGGSCRRKPPRTLAERNRRELQQIETATISSRQKPPRTPADRSRHRGELPFTGCPRGLPCRLLPLVYQVAGCLLPSRGPVRTEAAAARAGRGLGGRTVPFGRVPVRRRRWPRTVLLPPGEGVAGALRAGARERAPPEIP